MTVRQTGTGRRPRSMMNMWAHTGLWRDAGAIGLYFLRLFVLVCTTEYTVSL